MRFLIFAIILSASVASAQTISGGTMTGANIGVVAGVTYAAAADGVEDRCTELGANCLCSEPLNGPETAYGGVLNGDTGKNDPASSVNATECWGRAGYQGFASAGNMTMETVSTFGSNEYAMEQGETSGLLWLNGINVAAHLAVAGDQTICWRYYKQVDSDYGSTGSYSGECGPEETWRNKIFQTELLGQAVQLEEGEGGEACRVGNSYPIALSVDSGPNTGNYYPVQEVSFNDCKSAPCRLEMCMSGNIQNGTNIVYRAKVVPVSTGVESIVTSPTMASLSGSTNYFTWGGDVYHTGPGSSRLNYFMQAQWNDANVHWIGCAEEIEGVGCQ